MVDEKIIFKNINILFIQEDPEDMLQTEIDNINNIINRFSNKTPLINPYNFSAATEEKAYCDFTFTPIEPISLIKPTINESPLFYKNGDIFSEIYSIVNGVETKVDSIKINNKIYKIKYYTNNEKKYVYTSKIKFLIINDIPYFYTPLFVGIELNLNTYRTTGYNINLGDFIAKDGNCYFLKIYNNNNIIEYYRFYTDENDSKPISLINYSILAIVPYILPVINTTKSNIKLKLITHFTDDFIINNYFIIFGSL